jgi:tetratricopeptide (TPR) repeat protein
VSDPAADLLERAAEQALAGDLHDAGATALHAAQLLPAGDPDRLTALVSAATLLERAGDRSSAAVAQRAALTEAEVVHGPDSVAVAIAAQNLAVTCKHTGAFDEADDLYRRALAIAEATDGADDLVATICHNLGGLAHARHAPHAGIPWARRAVDLRARCGHELALAADRGALAGLLIDTGELAEAEAHLRAARRTFVELLGADDLEVAIVDGNLATIALERGDLETAERHARSALAVKERVLGRHHPDLAVTLTTLGVIRAERGDPDDAARNQRRARELLRPAVEPTHPLLEVIEENLAAATAAGGARVRPGAAG